MLRILILFFAAAIFTTHSSFGKLAKMLQSTDSASSAKFNVTISAPDELVSDSNGYNHHFFAKDDEMTFNFSASNNGEVVVVCVLKMNDNIQYDVFIDETIQNEFTIGIGETVNFQLVINADGLSASVTEASFFIDIAQAEGG